MAYKDDTDAPRHFGFGLSAAFQPFRVTEILISQSVFVVLM